jgi:trehalose 6-phosphate phosphatase
VCPASAAPFLDVDGTLVEFAPTPDSVRVPPQTLDLLRALTLRTGGSLALISGRPIAELDELFAPLLMPAAGLHGFERRNALGMYQRHPLPAGPLVEFARKAMHRIADRHTGLLVEDKRFALALHYRQAPHLANRVADAMAAIAERVTPDLELQFGKSVVELRPSGATKGGAVRDFMLEAPFRGRRPVYIGDDLTDETGFECVNAMGGLSIGVNISWPTAAQLQLPDPAAVHFWLHELLQRSAGPAPGRADGGESGTNHVVATAWR